MTVTVVLTPDDIVLRDETFALLLADPRQAAAIVRRIATLDAAFWFASREPDGLTLLLPEPCLGELGDLLLAARFEEHRYRVLTFLPVLPWNVVGFLAGIARELADAAIPLGAISAFERDHLFIRADLAARAQAVLQEAVRAGRLP